VLNSVVLSADVTVRLRRIRQAN